MIINGSLLLLGLSGPHLTSDEAARFRRIQPAGFVLLPRNLVSPHQTRQLTDDLRALSIELPIIALNHDGGPTSPLGALGLTTPTPAALAARGNMGDIADAAA